MALRKGAVRKRFRIAKNAIAFSLAASLLGMPVHASIPKPNQSVAQKEIQKGLEEYRQNQKRNGIPIEELIEKNEQKKY